MAQARAKLPVMPLFVGRSLLFASLVGWSGVLSWLAFRANGNRIGIDDADIFFAYASNFASGRGIVYSPGIDRVEGYTSTAWMLLSSAMFFLRLDEWGVLGINILLLAATFHVSLRLIDHFAPESRSRLLVKSLFLAILSSSLGFVSWATITLMDTGLWILLVVGMAFPLFVNNLQKHVLVLSGIAFFVAPLARPEAFLLAPIILLLLIVKRRSQGISRLGIISLAVAFVSSAVGLTIFRLVYFGLPFPNTFYAKVSPSPLYNLYEGFKYLARFLSENPFASIALVIAVYILFALVYGTFSQRVRRPIHLVGIPTKSVFFLILLIFVMLAIPVVSGGDHFGLYRFFQPSMLFLAILCSLVIAQILFLVDRHFVSQKLSPAKVHKAVGVVLTFSWLIAFGFTPNWGFAISQGSPIAHEFQIAESGRGAGEQLRTVFSADGISLPRVGVITAGGVARTYGGPIVDLMGLNNREIALYPGDRLGVKNHAAFEKDVFFRLSVDFLLTSPFSSFSNDVLKGLFVDPRFVKTWRYGTLVNQANSEAISGFYSSDFLDSAAVEKNFVFIEDAIFDSQLERWLRVDDQSESTR